MHILMLQQTYIQPPSKHCSSVLHPASPLLDDIFSWSTHYLEISANTGKCTTITMNVILVALISPFSKLHIVTFSDVEY